MVRLICTLIINVEYASLLRQMTHFIMSAEKYNQFTWMILLFFSKITVSCKFAVKSSVTSGDQNMSVV